MAFGVVPKSEWKLSEQMDAERRRRLLETPYEQIVSRICREAEMAWAVWERSQRTRGLVRAELLLRASSETVDLFHNGAGGIRAQFLQGVEQGEDARRMVVNALLNQFASLVSGHTQPKYGWIAIRESLLHRTPSCG
jgi:hypothetical protein